MAETLKRMVERSLEANAGSTALVCDDVELTYGELDDLSFVAAGELAEAGVERGDRVALLVANGLEYPTYDIAILRLGAAKVPLNDMLAADDIAFALAHSGARAIVVSDSLAELAAAAIESLDDPPAVVAASTIGDLLDGRPGTFRDLTVGPEDPVAIYYTGGTTGLPKAIVHSQGNLAANMLSTVIEAEIHRDERILVSTPLPHAAGLFTIAGIVRGARVVIERGFDVERVLAAIERHRITWTFMVPTMIYRTLDSPALAAHDHSTLRTILYGAAPIRPDRLAEAVGAFGPVFIQLYGQTECPNFATTLSKGDHLAASENPDILTSCGRQVLMAEVSIRDEQGQVLAPGEIGEVCMRAPYTMSGYLDDPGGTDERYFGSWLRSGDIATIDSAGYVYLMDRRNDMVISGGMNIYTTVVERAVGECPGVGQAAVIGVPDADWGESVHAVVTLSDGAVTEATIKEFAGGKLARYMRPKSVEIVAELPLTPYGKVDKKVLRAKYWSGRERQIS
jgi:fatty-acyl-CoA synthase/long-chain acyl-CoA synthetase